MSANSKRDAVINRYKTIIGRNIYSQDSVKRQCVYAPYKDGKYYSDCSSSILNTYYQEGVILSREGNTAFIHNKVGEKVDLNIVNGIPDETKMRKGDILLFRGNDPSRPLQIGHVEMYVGNNTLYGHGSNTPSVKNMINYCKYRENQKASNGLSKGLVEVKRILKDDLTEIPIEAKLTLLCDLNLRDTPNGNIVKVLGSGTKVNATAKCDKWLKVDGGYISGNYVTGWIYETTVGKWWYVEKNYSYPSFTAKIIDGKEYHFDKDGYCIDASRIADDLSVIY